MEMIKAVILSDIAETGFDIKSKIADENIAVVGFGDLDQRGFDKVLSLCPHVVILAGAKGESAFEVAGSIYFNLPHCVVMLMCDDIDMALMQKAMLSGIKKVVALDADDDTVRESVRECYRLESTRKTSDLTKSPSPSKVICVFGGKGGIGKTTIAANTALCLAKQGKKVIIIDANLQMGDMHMYFDCDPKDTLGELVYEGNLGAIEIIKSFITAHSSGVGIIASPKSPEYSEIVKAEHFESIINTLRPYYDYIIIDLPPAFTDATISCFENSDRILLLVGVDISSIRGARISLSILEKLRQDEKVTLVLNKYTKAVIGEKDVERVLARRIDYKVCQSDDLALNSLNKGIPIVEMYPKSIIGKQLKSIAESV